jgi:hypothetical protein
MNSEEPPEPIKKILERYPQLAHVIKAIQEYERGQEVTARCPTCHELLTITNIEVIGTLWVTCPNGCTSYHEAGKPYQP